ncbi:hypothetical protein RAS1_30220 [Phycisphaerae bacterium RAS1]|nr:hypothetical protein RAS1_30220 [Phycisphaerae bacterium RAS1]
MIARASRVFAGLAVLVGMSSATMAGAPPLLPAADYAEQVRANRCAFSTLTGVSPADSAAVLADLLDGDPRTGIRFAAGQRESLELRFVGAWRWLSSVRVTCDATLRVAWLDLNGAWQEVGVAAPDAGGRLQFPSARAMGLRFSLTGAEAMLADIHAGYEIDDPERFGGSQTYNAFAEGNDYGVELYYAADDAFTFGDEMNGVGTWAAEWYTEEETDVDHFKRTDLGGRNSEFADACDIAWAVGFTEPVDDEFYARRLRGMSMGLGAAGDDNELTPGDSHAALGDNDLEWLILNCSTIFKNEANLDAWRETMDRLHLLCGWKSAKHDVIMSDEFVRKVNGWLVFDPPRTIKHAWFDAVDATHGHGFSYGVVSESSTVADDYLLGEGDVGNDPTADDIYTYYYIDETGSQAAPRAAAAPVEMTRIDAGRPGWKIDVPTELLRGGGLPTQMPVFVVQPVMVDQMDVEALADRVCETAGRFCNAMVGPDEAMTELTATDGAWEIRVCTATGAPHIEATDRWLQHHMTAPMLPTSNDAMMMADQLLDAWEIRPSGAMFAGFDVSGQRERKMVNGVWDDVPGLHFPTALRVLYRRFLGSYPVGGPGGSMSVVFGDGGRFERIYRGAWRPVALGPTADLLPLQTVLDALAERGAAMVINGVAVRVQGIQINSVDAGYWEKGRNEMQSVLRPVYRLDTTITDSPPGMMPPETTDYIMAVYADALPPTIMIQGFEDGLCVAPDTQVCLTAMVSGGQPPYEIMWDDARDGPLGTGSMVCHTLTIAAHPLQYLNNHTLRATVRDARGSMARAAINACVVQRGDMNCDGAADVLDINAFVLALLDPMAYAAQFPNCDVRNGDVDGDGMANVLDINPFVALLLGG